MIEPLKFRDPAIERETYIAAFVASIIEKTDGTPLTLEKSLVILWQYGYTKASIAEYAEPAHEKAKQWLARTIS